MNWPLIACLLISAFFLLLENIGFLFRIAGFKANNLVAGYTFQNSWSFISRFFHLLFAPFFAFLADSNKIQIDFHHILIYYFSLNLLLYICIININSIINLLSNIIIYQQKGNSLIKSLLQQKNLILFIKIFRFRSFRKIINSFKLIKLKNQIISRNKVNSYVNYLALTYILFYCCWILISILITAFPSRPSFLISTSTFFTLSSSIYQSLAFDPWISRYSDNENLTTYVYKKLQISKFYASIISFLICILIYKLFLIFNLI